MDGIQWYEGSLQVRGNHSAPAERSLLPAGGEATQPVDSFVRSAGGEPPPQIKSPYAIARTEPGTSAPPPPLPETPADDEGERRSLIGRIAEKSLSVALTGLSLFTFVGAAEAATGTHRDGG